MFGYMGKILRINLTTGVISKEDLDFELAKKFIGGRGLGTKIFSDEVDPKVDPFAPENKIIIINGPLSGTATPTGGRYMVVTKSPLTGCIASSNSGGEWGAYLKYAGYDAIIVEGKASLPVYINIEEDKVEILPALDIWGKLVSETSTALKAKHPDAKVMTIGPAGEKLSQMACIMNEDDRTAGRSGVGGVMGSKNLKAITVKGNKKPEIARPDGLKTVTKECRALIKENGVTGGGLPTYGTAVLVNIINEHGVYPLNNFQKCCDPDAEAVSGETLTEKYLIKRNPCHHCPIGCGRWVKSPHSEEGIGGPEYETLWVFAGDLGINDMEVVIDANFWCNELGIDTISGGATLAAAMELYQRGYITDAELDDDVILKFGNAESVVHWLKKMGNREGFGDKLAQGSYRLANSYGVPEYSMSVKKQDLPAYDPRGIQGMALQYATSNRGGCHVRGYLISPEILGLPEKLDRFELAGKETWCKIFQDLTAVIDSSGLCLFTSFALGPQQYADMLNETLGTDWTAEDVLLAGERIWNIEKMFNLAAGILPEEDTLPPRLLKEEMPEGPSKGWVAHLDELLPLYYAVRGWDEQGIPTKERLEILGLL
ncbi:aldehyde ferredoxin oxidoreductase family protein [Acetobacterium sp.]|uniref:aldehyde ferredoxin oxidoreductase family protein n=1 Tax=Acetobacterium sp. TaxID=1872094 RepID=UPI002F4278DB